MQEPSSYDELKKYARSYQYLKQNLNQDSEVYDDESISDFDDSEFYSPLSYIGRSSIFNYSIESCFKTCSNCNNILGDSENHHCTKCNQYFSYIHQNGKKCLDFCDNENGYYLQQNTHNCLKDIRSEDYYLDFNEKIFQKCFYKCKTCIEDESKNFMICNPCNDDIFINITYKCNELCNYFYFENDKQICLKRNELCPESLPYELIINRKCIKDCSGEDFLTQTNK